MTKLRTIAALTLVATVTHGCDILDVLTGAPTKAQRTANELANRPPEYTPPPLDDLLAELAAKEATAAAVTPPPVVVPPPAVDPGPPPFECVTIFRVQTCDAGVLYALDSNGNWILPGRTQ